jgi:capsular polysaccharide biosynthesis protein
MELRDYGTALRRYWTTCVGLTVAGVLAALAVVLASTPTYQATAQVFVASTNGEGTSGAQFVNQRVTSYPDVARSRTVLGSVIDGLGIQDSLADLRARVSAVNPPDTSQIDISVSDEDPVLAASVANAVAEEFGTVVERLEQPGDGEAPVDLTVTDPATVPATPVFPDPVLLLLLGLVVGLALGTAAAVVRSRLDSRLYTDDDVRGAWGADAEDLTIHSATGRRGRHGRPATQLARQIEPLAEHRLVRVVAVSTADDGAAAHAVVEDVSAELAAWDVPVSSVADPRVIGAEDGPRAAGVRFMVSAPEAPLREWRRIAEESDAVVLVLESGRIDRAGLQEIRSVVVAAGIRLLAVVIRPRSRDAHRPVVVRQRGTVPPVPTPEDTAPKKNGVVTLAR